MRIAANTNRTHALALRFAFGCRSMVARAAQRNDSERGAVMSEYGLLLMVAMIAAFAIVMLFGNSVVGLFEAAYRDFTEAYSPAGP